MLGVSDNPVALETDHAGENAQLVALLHHLQSLGVRLVVAPPAPHAVADMVVDLLDRVQPLVSALSRVAPTVLVTLGELDKAPEIAVLCSELTEAHRQLGHALRDSDIDPGRPEMEIGDLVHGALDGGLARLQSETGNTYPPAGERRMLE